MQNIFRLFAITLIFMLGACGTSMHADREPEPELYLDSEDFYESLLTEIEYSDDQRELISTGRSMLGIPYIYGEQNIARGFDCSGFTQYVYREALGINLPRTAKQMYGEGEPVYLREDLKAGDLVFFNLLGFDYSHVGIYIGNGRFFHASTNKKKIVIGNLKNEYFAKRYNGARRIISAE